MAPGSEEDAHLNPALDSVAMSVGDLSSTDSDCERQTTKLIEGVLLLGVEE